MIASSLTDTPRVIRVLELFAAGAGVPFDRLIASRALGEAEQAIGGEGADAWAGCLVDVGESVNLRIRTVECSLREVVECVRQGVPAALCIPVDSKESGSVRWIVLARASGRRVQVVEVGEQETQRSVSMRRLRKLVRSASGSSSARWILGQPALGCQGPQDKASKAPLKPLKRLLGLIRPERSDLWCVLVFSLVVGMLALATPVAVEALVNTVAFGRYLQPVVVLAMLLFTFLAFAAGMRGLVTYVVEIIQRRLFLRVVEDLAYRLPRVQQEQFDELHGPEAANRFFDIVTVQKTAATLLLDGISIVLQTVIGMAVLAFYHPFLLGFDVVLVALICLIVFGLGRGAVKSALSESKAKYSIAAWLEELARHPTAFKLHSGSRLALERADELAVEWLDRRRAHFRIVIRQIVFALGLQAFAATTLLGLGGWLVIQGELTLGQLVAAELIVMMIVGSFAKLGKHMESFYDLLAAVDKLGQLFDLEIEPHDRLFHLEEGKAASVRLRGASYSYGRARGVAPCDFDLQPGESVALSGPAGAGKSTLIDMVSGVRSPSTGHIELDGVDLRELRPDSLREHVAVARSTEIFQGTIDENVHLSRPNVRAKDVRDALAAVGLLDEVLDLPDGLGTQLQTDGGPLTSSQSQRLMVARAIVGRPRLLLIDRSLDSLAPDQLAHVLRTLTAEDAPWSLLVATARPEVVSGCDRVFQLGHQASQPAAKMSN